MRTLQEKNNTSFRVQDDSNDHSRSFNISKSLKYHHIVDMSKRTGIAVSITKSVRVQCAFQNIRKEQKSFCY